MIEEPRVVVVRAGAIGSSIAGWIAPKYANLSLLARGETLEVIKNHGLKSYLKGQRATAKALSIHAIGSLDETAPPRRHRHHCEELRPRNHLPRPEGASGRS